MYFALPFVFLFVCLFFLVGWTMVFKIVGGVAPENVDYVWTSSYTVSENVNAALDVTTAHQGHYKNRIIQNWEAFNPREVCLYSHKMSKWKLNATIRTD